jgi:magnesium-protoporphyrin IX monomethyl ester (oxidative) cyclase
VTSRVLGLRALQRDPEERHNPDIKALMRYMARDESRHAGFINQSLKDFGLGVDLGGLKRTKAYTYFKPKYIFYATYLSEKIGYARYITIFRQLERHPDKRFHPIFRWFERWCNDEFRHGESLRADHARQPAPAARRQHCCGSASSCWPSTPPCTCATTRGRCCTRRWAWTPPTYDYEVFRITSEISKQVFPISLDIDHPAFRAGMDRLFRMQQRMDAAKAAAACWASSSRRRWRSPASRCSRGCTCCR